jgi:hypothetical protein
MDFDAAEMFLALARKAQATGDDRKMLACRKMIAVALEIPEGHDAALHKAAVPAGRVGTGR